MGDKGLRLQGFVDASIEGLKSTDAALRALRQFRAVLTREGLRAGLDAKRALVFQRFGADVEGVQAGPTILTSISQRKKIPSNIHYGVLRVGW